MSFLLQRRLRAFLRTTTVLAGSAPTVLAGAVPTILAGAAPAVAQTTSAPAAASAPVNIGGVQSTASGTQGGASIAPVPTTATQFAPSYTPLTAIQPTSVVDSGTLQKLAPQTDDYNEIVNLTPSTTDISPAGPGLQQDFGQSIRGLQYTEFSVLWDGIPVPGFPFNFAPQPGAYFLGRDFASVTVNRGPGQASAIGDATFGGSVDLAAENPIATPQVETYGTFGSFGTKFFGIQGNTGAISQTGGTEGVLDLTREEALGADTGIGTERRNLYAKIEQPIGDATVVTFAINADNDFTKTPYGATFQSIDAYGRNYNLNDDPTSQSYDGYARDNYTTDFMYVGVASHLGDGWVLDNKSYQTEYIQRDQHGADVGGTAPNLSGTIYIDNAPVDVANDVPGVFNHLDYEDWGDVLRLSKAFAFGDLRFGIWGDREGFNIYSYNSDLTRDGVPFTTASGTNPFTAQYFSDLVTIQPYAEFAYRATKRLTLTAGVKYSSVTRNIQGPNFNGGPTDTGATYNQALPSFDANYRVTKELAVYAQAAKGYLAPELGVLGNQAATSVQPSTTWSYQIGTALHRRWLSLGADLYYIDFDNYIDNTEVANVTTYFNQGGATFKGIELEATVTLGQGFAVYANGTLNDSNYVSNGNNLAQTPRRTAAVALLYDRGSVFRHGDEIYGNITSKVVGPQYAVDTATNGAFDQFPIKTWDEVDLSAGYILPVFHRRLRAAVNVTNLFDHQSITGYDGMTAEGQALYWVQAGRGVFFSVAAYL